MISYCSVIMRTATVYSVAVRHQDHAEDMKIFAYTSTTVPPAVVMEP